jgi:hypothetical protein
MQMFQAPEKFFLVLFLVAMAATWAQSSEAAMRDNPFEWTQDCATINGDTLDPNGDGVCELLTLGFRFYTESGEFITGIAEDGTRSYNVRYNMPWGLNQCHYMTAVMDDPLVEGGVLESVPSNVGACRDVVPGDPKSPTVNN